MISRVTQESLEYVWGELRTPIQKALSHGAGDCTTEAVLFQAVKSGLYAMWVIHDEYVRACVIVSVKEYPNKKTVFVELTAGKDLDVWIEELESTLRDYKEHVGAQTIEACMRTGLMKRLNNWRTKAILAELQ